MRRIIRSIFVLFGMIFLISLSSCSEDILYKNCESIIADDITLSSSKSVRNIYEYVNEDAEIKTLYAPDSFATNEINTIKYNDVIYTLGLNVGILITEKKLVKYNESSKKAIVYDEKNARDTLPKEIYNAMKENAIYVDDRNLSYVINLGTEFNVTVSKIIYSKIETHYDFSNSSYIKFVYA